MRRLDIHILKHAKIGDAEEVLLEFARGRGHTGKVVDPCAGVLSLDPSGVPDVVIGRCELDSFSDAALGAYMAYFDWCRAGGASVVNSLEFLLACQDKFRTHMAVRNHLRAQGIEDTINPETLLCFGRSLALAPALQLLQRYGAVVVKKPHSGWGEGVFLAQTPHELHTLLERELTDREPIMLQQPIDKETNERGGFKDLRVLACRDGSTGRIEIAAAYYRNGAPGEFKTNGSHGGGISSAGATDPELLTWTRLVMNALGGDIAGLDFARDGAGRYWLLEANIAFETYRSSSLTMFGDSIWQRAVDLAEWRAWTRQ